MEHHDESWTVRLCSRLVCAGLTFIFPTNLALHSTYTEHTGLASSKTLGPVNGKTRTASSLSKKLPTLQKLSTTYVDTPFLKSISTSAQAAHSDVKTHQTEDPVSTSKEIVSHTNSAIKPSSRVAPVIPTSNKEVPSSVSPSSGTIYIVSNWGVRP